MQTCPICNTPSDSEAQVCPACGYHFKADRTQAFKVVPVQTDTPAPATLDDESAATLTVQYGRQEGVSYKLNQPKMVIGRAPRSHIFLNDMTVSRTHALVERVGDGWSIKDDGSFNGVWINNQSIDHAMLHDGDIIQVGCFVLKYREN